MRAVHSLLEMTAVCAILLIASNDQLWATDGPPVITGQPQPQTAFVGANVNLRVSATSLTGIRYQWRFFGTNLPNDFPGQLTPLLTLQRIAHAAAGPYSVVLNNNFGAVTSRTAVVTVNDLTEWVVGYVNLSAVPGYSLFALPLGQSGGYQTVAEQIPATVDGASLFKMDGNGFIANNFLDGWSAPDMILTLGEGWFFHNPRLEPASLTLLGNVQEGQLVNRLPAGYSVCASVIPQAGLLSSDLSFPLTPGARVVRFEKSSQNYVVYQSDATAWQPSEPSAAVCEAFWVYEPHDQDWVRDFQIIGFGWYLIVQPLLASQTPEINFFTYHPDGLSGRVLDLDGITPLNHEFVGQLYAGKDDDEPALAPIGKPVPFLDGAGAGYIRDATVKLPGFKSAQNVFFQLRVWEICAGDTYEQAVLNGSASGRSAVFSATVHATIEATGPGLPPQNANTFPAFQISPGAYTPLRVARIQCSGASVEICFATQPGGAYCLQKASSGLHPMVWSTVAGAAHIVGTGHAARVTDTATQPAFYRVCKLK